VSVVYFWGFLMDKVFATPRTAINDTKKKKRADNPSTPAMALLILLSEQARNCVKLAVAIRNPAACTRRLTDLSVTEAIRRIDSPEAHRLFP
jgi:hypothetical protein